MTHHVPSDAPPAALPKGWLSRLLWAYDRVPLYLRILAALILGIAAGFALREETPEPPAREARAEEQRPSVRAAIKENLEPVYKFVLQLLTMLATPLIFLAIIHALYRSSIDQGQAGTIIFLLLTNTLAAILIGVGVANLMRPGEGADLAREKAPEIKGPSVTEGLPISVARPFVANDIMGVIFLAVAVGIGLRFVRHQMASEDKSHYEALDSLLEVGMRLVMVLLHWIVALVPLAVFAVVAQIVGTRGLAAFRPMLWFVIAVMVALLLQAVFYLARLRVGSWVSPGRFLRGGFDALLMSFSTASSAATMPVTFKCLRDKIGLREQSAGLGAFVGGTFNHDGTALYEAMAALFISQVIGQHLGLWDQIIIVIMAVVASVGAAGIPEAGLVTMIAVFKAVNLPIEYIPLLLTVDWFLDRCRTAMNVMGDMTVGCLLDGRTPEVRPSPGEEGDETIAAGVGPVLSGGDEGAGG